MNQKQWIWVSCIGLLSAGFCGAFGLEQAVGQSTLDLATFRETALSLHNDYRSTHRAPDLTLNGALSESAQDWAEQLAATGEFEHSGIPGVGENLYASYTTASSVDAAALATDAVQSWYSEVSAYDYGNPSFSMETGHFTQIVWKNTTDLGCGAAQGVATLNGRQYNAFYVVCQYLPPGNVEGQFPANVLQP